MSQCLVSRKNHSVLKHSTKFLIYVTTAPTDITEINLTPSSLTIATPVNYAPGPVSCSRITVKE